MNFLRKLTKNQIAKKALIKNFHFENLNTHLKLQTLPSQEKFFYTASLLGLLFLLINSFSFGQDFDSDIVPSAYAVYDPIFQDDEGYLIKSMPATSKGDYSNRTDIVSYEIKSGDSVSMISSNFGVKISTILENNPSLGAGQKLKIGQKIIILPVDGLLYEVKKGDSFSSIEKKYSIKADDIKRQNNIDSLVASKQIILPGARLPRVEFIAQTSTVAKGSGGSGYVNIGTQIMDVSPSISGITNPVPVNGRWSRGTKGHTYYAVDISRKDKSWVPNIIASCDGTVEVAKSSGRNGGYGLYIIIACDNGYDVLTAHHSKVYVQYGDRVTQGQVIALMGATGAATGVHCHFEVRKNGSKLEPLNFITVPGQP